LFCRLVYGDASGNYVTSIGGPAVPLAANTWTKLTLIGVRTTDTRAVSLGMEPNFTKGSKGGVMYWDDMSLTT